MKIGFLVGLIALGAFVVWRMMSGPNPEALWVVRFDTVAISVTTPDPEVHSIRWDQLVRVDIRTTDDGQWAPDVFWGLHPAQGPPVVFLNGATGVQEILGEMERRLPGYRDDQVIKAMGSTSNALFVVWEK